MTIFLCDEGFDGILTGVYEIYASRLPREACRLEIVTEYEPELFADYRETAVDKEKADKVAKKIRGWMSEEAYIRLYRAALHKSPDRAEKIFQFIELGLVHGKSVIRMLQNPVVYEIFQMDRYVGREALAQREFARFERLSSGIYYGKIGPENRVLEFVAEHFADRFPDMNWVLYDEKHHSAAIHSAENGAWVIRTPISDLEIEALLEIKSTDRYTGLWKIFFQTIAIEERRNDRCQRNMLPLRYRKYMTEFQ